MEFGMLVFYTGHPALDAGSRIQGLDFRLRGNDREETRDPFPPVILNRKQSASDWGSIRTGFPLARE